MRTAWKTGNLGSLRAPGYRLYNLTAIVTRVIFGQGIASAEVSLCETGGGRAPSSAAKGGFTTLAACQPVFRLGEDHAEAKHGQSGFTRRKVEEKRERRSKNVSESPKARKQRALSRNASIANRLPHHRWQPLPSPPPGEGAAVPPPPHNQFNHLTRPLVTLLKSPVSPADNTSILTALHRNRVVYAPRASIACAYVMQPLLFTLRRKTVATARWIPGRVLPTMPETSGSPFSGPRRELRPGVGRARNCARAYARYLIHRLLLRYRHKPALLPRGRELPRPD